MDGKLHIKATAGRNIKVDAYLYRYGEKMDCYLTPNQFKDYVDGFLDYEILTDGNSGQKSINVDYKVVDKKEVIANEQQIQKPRQAENNTFRKGAKKNSK